MDWAALARQAAQQAGHPWPDLFVAQMRQESGFNEDVIYCRRFSSAGAMGIAQFMPATAAGLGVDPCNPTAALAAAARLMVSYYNRYGDWAKALAAYNAGPGNVDKYGGVPPFAETQSYVSSILASAGQPQTGGGGTGSTSMGQTGTGGGGTGGGGANSALPVGSGAVVVALVLLLIVIRRRRR